MLGANVVIRLKGSDKMIRDSIEKGTKVRHNDYGVGLFLEWHYRSIGDIAVVQFEGNLFCQAIPAEDLTEVE